MKQTLDSTELYKPIVPVLSNVSVESESSTEGIKNNLINQVVEMVRWREIMTRFEQDGVIDFYEIGSGSVLSNLAKRSCPSFNRKSINDKPSVENFLHSLDKRGTK